MGKDLKSQLSNDVYTAFKNIAGTAKELGGGRDKSKIDSTTEYKKLAQLIAGQGDVARNKMTETDIKTLQAMLANAEKWKPLGDDFEKSATDNKTEKTEQKQVDEGKKSENTNNIGDDAPKNKESQKTQETDRKKTEPNKPENKKPENKKPEPKPQPKESTQTQNNSFYNSGVNNSLNNNSGVIIIDKSIHFGSTNKTEAPKTNPSAKDKSKEQQKEDTIKANKENYQVAYDEGSQVAKDLIGPTSDKQKRRSIRNIQKQNENTIIGFMQGFYDNDTVMGVPYGKGDLLDLIDNEGDFLGGLTDANWSDAERQRAFMKIMESTLKYAEKTGNTSNPNFEALQALLKDVKAGKDIQTETADAYIRELITNGAFDVNS